MNELKECCFEEQQQIQSFNDVEENQDIINKILDFDSLVHIFKMVPIPDRIEMEKVCVKWKEACQAAWYDTKKFKYDETINHLYNVCMLTNVLSKCGNYLQELTLSTVCKSSIMPTVAEHCNNLTRLEFVFDVKSTYNISHYTKAFIILNKLKYIKIHVITTKNTSDNGWYNQRVKLPMKIINHLSIEIEEIHLIIDEQLNRPLVHFDLKKFKYLHSLTLKVCNFDKILQQILKQKTLVYLDLDLQHFDITRNNFPFKQLVNLEHIIIIGHTFIIDLLDSILTSCKNIKYLDLHGEVHVKYCKNSKYLFIEQFSNEHTINVKTFKKLIKLGSIECLELNSLELTNELEIIIFVNCTTLKKFIVKKCTREQWLNNENYPANNDIDSLINQLVDLEHIQIINCKLTSSSLDIILATCKKLKYLKVSSQKIYVEYNKDLKYLIVKKIKGEDISKNTLQKLMELENFECLEFNSLELSDTMMIAILNNFTKVKKLEIIECTTEQYVKLEQLTPAIIFDELSKLQYLEYLNLSSTKELGDSSIIAIANNCKNLKYLDISYCKLITETGLLALTLLENLENLNVASIDGVTDNIMGKLKGLKFLECHSNKEITEAGIIQLWNNNPDLEHLDVHSSDIFFSMIIEANKESKNPLKNIISRIKMMKF